RIKGLLMSQGISGYDPMRKNCLVRLDELYLAVEDIDHTRTKAKSPQTNGICERFHRTVLDEFYRVAFRKKIYRTIDELLADLDVWIAEYNRASQHPSVYAIEGNKVCCSGGD